MLSLERLKRPKRLKRLKRPKRRKTPRLKRVKRHERLQRLKRLKGLVWGEGGAIVHILTEKYVKWTGGEGLVVSWLSFIDYSKRFSVLLVFH